MSSDALACEGRDDLFFPDDDNYSDTPEAVERTNQAKAMCAACPLLRDCGVKGKKEDWGIWGGLTPDERRRARL
jgi:WhiB family redox-sensing transcriptional regulator